MMVPPGATCSFCVLTEGNELSKSPIMSSLPAENPFEGAGPPPPSKSSSSSSASATVAVLSAEDVNCSASSPRAARSRARKSEGSSTSSRADAPVASVLPVLEDQLVRGGAFKETMYPRQILPAKGSGPP